LLICGLRSLPAWLWSMIEPRFSLERAQVRVKPMTARSWAVRAEWVPYSAWEIPKGPQSLSFKMPSKARAAARVLTLVSG
jgi:hypothetical protein